MGWGACAGPLPGLVAVRDVWPFVGIRDAGAATGSVPLVRVEGERSRSASATRSRPSAWSRRGCCDIGGGCAVHRTCDPFGSGLREKETTSHMGTKRVG